MIYFILLQVCGVFNLFYSLYDQLGWDLVCFLGGEKDVQKMVDSLESNYFLLSLIDIVLNYIVNNIEWLNEYFEVGYNLIIVLWLELVYFFDIVFLEFSLNFS